MFMDLPLDMKKFLINNFLDIKTLLIFKKTNKNNFNLVKTNKFDFKNYNIYNCIVKSILYKDYYFFKWLKNNNIPYRAFSSFSILLSDDLAFIKFMLHNFGLYSHQYMLELFMINIRKGKFTRSLIKNICRYACKSKVLVKLLNVIYRHPSLYKKKKFRYNEIVKLILIKFYKLQKKIKN